MPRICRPYNLTIPESGTNKYTHLLLYTISIAYFNNDVN